MTLSLSISSHYFTPKPRPLHPKQSVSQSTASASERIYHDCVCVCTPHVFVASPPFT